MGHVKVYGTVTARLLACVLACGAIAAGTPPEQQPAPPTPHTPDNRPPATAAPSDSHPAEPATLTAPATAQEIDELVKLLGDAAFERRTHATRRLCAIGMPAAAKLRAAAEGDDFEVALRARKILAVFDNLLFAGVEVRLTAAREEIAWNDPLTVRLTFTNRSEFPARVPFETDAARRAALAEGVLRAGDMLDFAEFAECRGPGGRPVDLRVQDLDEAEGAAKAVADRLVAGPTSTLAPGETVVLELPEVNRGWARFPLLEAGAHTLVIEYVPRWDDEVLAAQQVGRVVSNHLLVKVREPAPASVARDAALCSVSVALEEGTLVARLTNHRDVPLRVNRNFGPAAPFAQGTWLAGAGDRAVEIMQAGPRHLTLGDFRAEAITEVAPGAAVELARITTEEFQAACARQAPAVAGELPRAQFRYVNLSNRRWQALGGREILGNERVPPVLRDPLPTGMLVTQQLSAPLTLPEPKPAPPVP